MDHEEAIKAVLKNLPGATTEECKEMEDICTTLHTLYYQHQNLKSTLNRERIKKILPVLLE
ncbi:MAG: hypothetical protein HYW85_01085 [Deltaproteobacteria bacterium]|nr:hypothetical protein [Deltaproteobacteria bacterium]MBI3017832.1 hypothetical protein [Deltaproteobacteria bacterium]